MAQLDIAGATAGQLADGLADGRFTSVELVSAYLDAIENCPDQSIFIRVTASRALDEARRSDLRRQSGATQSRWDGIPFAWKDVFDVRGLPTTAGSDVYRNAEAATSDAAVLENCRRLGAITLGKTNMSEFGYSGLGLNPHYGTPENPHGDGVARVPGGSSAGSAIAVARGLAPVAIGTDTAGSVRVPASFCGVAGFKSSHNRYSKAGVFQLSSSLDSFGCLGRSVSDLVQVDAMMRGIAEPDLKTMTLDEMSFVAPTSVVFDDVDSDIADAFDQAVAALETAGATITREAFPIFEQVTRLFSTHGTLTVAEAFTLHEELLNSEDAARMDQRVRTRLLTANTFSTSDYIRLQWERETLQRKTAECLQSRFLLFPTTPMTAPELAALEASDELFAATNLKALRNTMLGNYLGTPGVSLPIGKDRSGLPVGALVSAPFGEDDRVLAAALAMQGALAGRAGQ